MVLLPLPVADLDPATVGKKVYEGVCVACHGSGAAGAPKFGDKTAWAPRLSKGEEALLASATKGLNAMPAKGGYTGSDAEFKAAVQYLTGCCQVSCCPSVSRAWRCKTPAINAGVFAFCGGLVMAACAPQPRWWRVTRLAAR